MARLVERKEVMVFFPLTQIKKTTFRLTKGLVYRPLTNKSLMRMRTSNVDLVDIFVY